MPRRELLIHRLRIELSHFRLLSLPLKKLLVSFALLCLAYPIIFVFVSAYLWRSSADLYPLIIYNLGTFISLPLGFYLNGWLLGRFHIKHLYFLGALLLGVAPVMVIYATDLGNQAMILYGLIFGLGSGFYWANKNYLTLKLTKGTNRIYYNSMETIANVLTRIIAPVISGYLIVAGEYFGWYSLTFGYQLAVLLGLVLLLLSGLVLLMAKIDDVGARDFVLRLPSSAWQFNRLFIVINDTLRGVNFFVPSILILVLLGDEGTLGLVNSLSAVLASLALYIVGRKVRLEHALPIMAIGIIVYLISSLFLAISFSAPAVLLVIAVSTIYSTVQFTIAYTVSMELIDTEIKEDALGSQYAYICDNELFFNFGRVIGAAAFVVLLLGLGQELSLRVILPLLVLVQLLGLYPMKKMIAAIINK